MINLRRITIAIFTVNLLLTSYTAYIFFFSKFLHTPSKESPLLDINDSLDVNIYDDWNPWGEDLFNDHHNDHQQKLKKSSSLSSPSNESVTIEIWSKAAIGLYLWEHILRGRIDKKTDGGIYSYGFKKINRYKFKFRTGPALTVNSLQQLRIPNLIVILNGRDKEKIQFAVLWLNAIKKVSNIITNVGIVLLGDERCYNNWIEPYLYANGGPIKFLFIVYDWKRIDNQLIHQMPLGVATYRDFPNPHFSKLNLQLARPYICNFLGTVYRDSSREELLKILTNEPFNKLCFVKTRYEWTPKETKDSLNVYVEALRLSDLTLCPIGMNHECYRIYEAASFGSVPVIEENLRHVIRTNCDLKSTFRILKKYNAPFIYISNWTKQLPNLIESERNLSYEYKINRRIELIKWYHNFKINIKNNLMDVIDEKFFSDH